MHSRPELSGTVLSGHPVFSSQLAAKYGICFPFLTVISPLSSGRGRLVLSFACIEPSLNAKLLK